MKVLDEVKTGENIKRLMQERGITIRDVQKYFGFNSTQAIYYWINSKRMPSLDNLVIMTSLFDVTLNDIIIMREV